MNQLSQMIFKEEVYQIIGSAIEVHNKLGCGFLEPVYQEAFNIELAERHIPARPQVELKIEYKGHKLEKSYIADYVIFEKIIVEIKAIENLTKREESQILNYLKATGFELGLLINFGAQSLQWKRMVHSKNYLSLKP
jgi:GxxExxY protein